MHCPNASLAGQRSQVHRVPGPSPGVHSAGRVGLPARERGCAVVEDQYQHRRAGPRRVHQPAETGVQEARVATQGDDPLFHATLHWAQGDPSRHTNARTQAVLDVHQLVGRRLGADHTARVADDDELVAPPQLFHDLDQGVKGGDIGAAIAERLPAGPGPAALPPKKPGYLRKTRFLEAVQSGRDVGSKQLTGVGNVSGVTPVNGQGQSGPLRGGAYGPFDQRGGFLQNENRLHRPQKGRHPAHRQRVEGPQPQDAQPR